MEIASSFSQVYCDNQNKKTQQKILKNLQFRQKSASKIGTKVVVVVKEINPTKKMLNALPRDYRKDGSRSSQELVRPHPSQVQGYKSKNVFEKRPWGHPACTGGPRKLFSPCSVTQALKSCHSHSPRRLGYCSR